MVKITFHVFVLNKFELILNSETGKIESTIFTEPFQAKSMKVYDGVVFRGHKKTEIGESDIGQVITLARSFWEMGGVKVEIVKLKLSKEGSTLKRIELTEKNDLDSVMWGLH